MNNIQTELQNKNHAKEKIMQEPYEIVKANETPVDYDLEGSDIAEKICELLIKSKMSYLQMNEVLYQADKALRYKALSNSWKF